jgi:hypothetical protein
MLPMFQFDHLKIDEENMSAHSYMYLFRSSCTGRVHMEGILKLLLIRYSILDIGTQFFFSCLSVPFKKLKMELEEQIYCG